MTLSSINPYASPGEDAVQHAAPTSLRAGAARWRLIPTVLFGVLGLLSFLLGILGLASFLYYAFRPGPLPGRAILYMLIASAFYLGIGVCWLLAARFYWRRQFPMAIAATFVGIVIPFVLAWLMI